MNLLDPAIYFLCVYDLIKKMFYSFIFFIFFLSLTSPVHAFLPPEFFVQGLTSLWIVIASGVVVAISPFFMVYSFLRTWFQKHKKLIILLLFQNIIIAIIVALFFYFQFYKPLYDDSYLFPKEEEISQEIDPAQFNEQYNELGGILKDPVAAMDYKYGVSAKEIIDKIKKGAKIYFIDIREIEEYQAGHIIGAIHSRFSDFSENLIPKLFSLTQENINKSIFIVYCHNGDRGLIVAKKLKKENIKYLIGGIESLYKSREIPHTGSVLADKSIFGEKYQWKFQSRAADVIPYIKKDNAIILDMRLLSRYIENHIANSLWFKIGAMTESEYKKALEKLLDQKNKKFIIITERYSELFYANLLILRLERDYGFTDNQFSIVFNQFQVFEEDPDIKFEKTESNI